MSWLLLSKIDVTDENQFNVGIALVAFLIIAAILISSAE
jgi:hypothetical protein